MYLYSIVKSLSLHTLSYLVWHHEGSLGLLEGVSAQHPLPHLRRSINKMCVRTAYLRRGLPWPCQQVYQGVTITAVQSERLLVARHSDLVHVLGQLYLGLRIHFHQLEDTAKGWLPLTGHKVRAYPKACDLVALLVEAQDGLLVDVVGGGDDEVEEPGEAVLGGQLLKGAPHDTGQVGQVT